MLRSGVPKCHRDAFLKAAKDLASDTIDDHVSFNQFLFSAADVNELFCGDGDDPLWCEADHKAALKLKGCRIHCSLVATRTCAVQDAPRTLFLDVDRTRKRKNPRVICNSLLAADLRLQSRHGNIEVYGDLTKESPLTKLMCARMPLPMFLGLG